MKLPSALSHFHIILFLVSLLCLLVSDITCFSHNLIAVSPSQTLRHCPNYVFFLSSVGFYNRVSLPEATDLLIAEVWRSIICQIWFLGKISIFRFCLRVFQIQKLLVSVQFQRELELFAVKFIFYLSFLFSIHENVVSCFKGSLKLFVCFFF